ncbi:MAG: mechanosensitive ion channel family protein [Acidobacteriota bacterium]
MIAHDDAAVQIWATEEETAGMLEKLRQLWNVSGQDGPSGSGGSSGSAETASSPDPSSAEPSSLELPAWVPEPITKTWEMIDQHPLVGFFALVVLGLLAAKIAQMVITRGLARLAAKTATSFDDKLIAYLHRPVFQTVFLSALALATKTLGLPNGFTDTVVNILMSIVVLTWLFTGFSVCRLVLDALGRIRDRFEFVEERTIPLFEITLKLLVFGGATYVLLMVWEIDPAPWLASAGVVGIAVGFAAKDTLANLFAGFFIVADAPYKLGDFVVLPTGERGMVTNVGIRSTRLLTRDDIEITVPNALIANAKIINESGGPAESERIRIKVGVAYGSDVDQVCEVLQKIAIEHDHIMPHPAPRVRMRAFGASSLDFELLCWIDSPVRRGKLSHELYMEVYKTFEQLGIEIPFAQTDVRIKEMPSS